MKFVCIGLGFVFCCTAIARAVNNCQAENNTHLVAAKKFWPDELVFRSPALGIMRLLDDMENLAVSDIPNPMRWSRSRALAPVDLRESDQSYSLDVDAPGVAKDDIRVTIHNHVLSIAYERNTTTTKDSDNYHVVERIAGKVKRSVALPPNVKEDDIKAKYANGVLHVTIPKVVASPMADSGVKCIDIHE